MQRALLQTLLVRGEAALHDSIQRVWPVEVEGAFGALPTPVRLRADPCFTGRAVTIALINAGFYPHADLVLLRNRVRAWADASREPHLPPPLSGTGTPPRRALPLRV